LKALKNNGKLQLTYSQVLQLIKKWENSVPARLSKLYPVKLKAKDPDALKIFEDAKKNKGKANLTPEEMKKLLEKWEAQP
jgi:hypothetical protein